MEWMEAIRSRHAVRSYQDRPLERAALEALEAEIAQCNAESGLHIQLAAEATEAFQGLMAHYGKFRNVRNYIALVGKKGPDLEEKAGYYGERIVLRAAALGLNTCWVALSYRKGKSRCHIGPGEKLVCVITVGYGQEDGVPHDSKPMEALCRVPGEMPDWFRAGMEAAMLAPTAVNQQKFLLTLDGAGVRAETTGGFFSRVDLGIVKCHFEIGAGRENVTWK